VSVLPPYNEHLVRDVGGLNLAFAVLLTWAAASLDRRLLTAGLTAYLVNAVPHFIFHVTELDRLSTLDQIGETATLAAALVLPLVLLLPALRLPAAREGA
ncbi:MAG TPA: EF-hand domain-containing protein, partial [Dehalococcoidia bacterium]|nr:EF-hand domain-containing protein [Dehalococcoidia bacterium]